MTVRTPSPEDCPEFGFLPAVLPRDYVAELEGVTDICTVEHLPWYGRELLCRYEIEPDAELRLAFLNALSAVIELLVKAEGNEIEDNPPEEAPTG